MMRMIDLLPLLLVISTLIILGILQPERDNALAISALSYSIFYAMLQAIAYRKDIKMMLIWVTVFIIYGLGCFCMLIEI